MKLDALVSILGSRDHWSSNADNLVQVDQLRDLSNGGAYVVTGATITGVMTDDAGAAIGSPITFAYVGGSNGRYLGTVPNSALLLISSDVGLRQMTLTITATVAATPVGSWSLTRQVKAVAV